LISIFFLLIRYIFLYTVLKDHLYQKHIKSRSSRNRQQHLPFPQMEKDHCQNSQQFRYAMAPGKRTDIAQTVDHQQAKHRPGEHFPQILYIFGGWLSCRKEKKGQISGKGGPQDYHSYSNNLL